MFIYTYVYMQIHIYVRIPDVSRSSAGGAKRVNSLDMYICVYIFHYTDVYMGYDLSALG